MTINEQRQAAARDMVIRDLAQLLSGLRALPGPEYPGDLRTALSGLEYGPVARLTCLLGLDDPGMLLAGTERAIRTALTGDAPACRLCGATAGVLLPVAVAGRAVAVECEDRTGCARRQAAKPEDPS